MSARTGRLGGGGGRRSRTQSNWASRLRGPAARIALAALLVAALTTAAGGAYITVSETGPASNRVNMVFLGDGYTASQIDTVYASHVNAAIQHFFGSQEPLARYRNFFNVYRINIVSSQSGADVPPQGIYVDTALDATYYGDGVTERLLCVSTYKANQALSAGLAGAGFTADIQLVTVNATRYGGSGGYFSVFAGGHSSGPEIALHEMAHSFSGLADEYGGYTATYGGGEPAEPNVTKSPTGAKWAHWIGYDQPGIGVIGVYEGAKYYNYGLYRPSLDSKMRTLGLPFNAVCREQIILDIYDLVRPLDAWLADDRPYVDPETLWVDVVDPAVVQVEWYANGERVPGAEGETFRPTAFLTAAGLYSVTARAFDATDWVRIGLGALQQSVTWSITLTHVPEPTTVTLMALGLVAVMAARRRRP